MSERVLVEREGAVAVVTVNRPDKLNALDNDLIAELTDVFEGLGTDADVRVVVLTGAGEKAFVAGADIAMLAEQGVLDGRENSRLGQRLTLAIESSPKPVLAAINGYALGGGLEVALACDVRFASRNARLGLPEVSLNIIPGYGGTQRLPRLVPIGEALRMILTGEPITADEALRIGLVSGVFEPAELMSGVLDVARKIASRGATAVALAKEAVRRGAALSLEEGLALEADLFGLISSTQEMRDGLRAFLERGKKKKA